MKIQWNEPYCLDDWTCEECGLLEWYCICALLNDEQWVQCPECTTTYIPEGEGICEECHANLIRQRGEQ